MWLGNVERMDRGHREESIRTEVQREEEEICPEGSLEPLGLGAGEGE